MKIYERESKGRKGPKNVNSSKFLVGNLKHVFLRVKMHLFIDEMGRLVL